MPIIRLSNYRAEFDSDIDGALGLAEAFREYRTQNADGTFSALSGRMVETLTGMTLLRVQLAWENFVENVFVRYICGGSTDSGYAPTLLNPPHATLALAMNNLLGSTRYLNWSVGNIKLRSLAQLDQGEPFTTALLVGGAQLVAVADVRNAIAHRSSYARQQFRAIVTTEVGYVPRGMTPGRFVASSPGGVPATMLERYCAMFKTLAPIITP